MIRNSPLRQLVRASAIALLAGSISCLARAGTLVEAQLVGQVQQTFDGKDRGSCGIVISGLESISGAPSGQLLAFNGSFSIANPNGGIVKGRASEVSAKLLASGNAKASDIRALETQGLWMKGAKSPVTGPMAVAPLRRSSDPGYLVYGSDFDSVFGLVTAVHERQPIQIGVKVKGRSFEQAMFGVVKLTEAEHEQFWQCIGEWSAAVLKKNDEGEVAGKPSQ